MPLVSLALALALSSAACSVPQKEAVLKTAFDEPGRRAEFFEATLRVLDEHPGYVDEFFEAARRHTPTLDRFLADDARDLDDPTLARMTAAHLAKNPASLREIMIATLDAAKHDPAAKAAIAAAIEARAATSADVITGRPGALSSTLEDSVALLVSRPNARAAFLEAMQKVAPTVAAFLVNNPKTLKAMMAALLKQGFEAGGDDVKALFERDHDE